MSKELPMNGNPYVETLQNARGGYAAEILAQLAVAYEQRTSNLLAHLSVTVQIQLSGLGISEELKTRAQLIENRLGLGDTK